MPSKEQNLDPGGKIATLAVDHVAHDAECYCDQECERILLESEPRINELIVEGHALQERESAVKARMDALPPPTDPRKRKLLACYYAGMGLMLALTAYGLTVIGFEPFRLGRVGKIISLGVAFVTPFAVHEFLETWKSRATLKMVVIAVFIAALFGGGLLAAIRGKLLARMAEDDKPAVVIEGETGAAAPEKPSFYESTGGSLEILMLFLAIAIDLGSGIALHRACAEWNAIDGEYEKLSAELAALRGRLAEIWREITALKNAPAVFAAKFWRDFYGAALTQTVRKAAAKGVAAALIAFALASDRASAAGHTVAVMALDTSVSEGVKGDDGRTPFDRNVDAIAKTLAASPPDSHIAIIGITKDSMADPYPLLNADIGPDEGYFGERLAAARKALVRAWRARAAKLASTAKGTDIVGALGVASDIFRKEPKGSRMVLAIFSDMRNATKALNLEMIPKGKGGARAVPAPGFLVALHGVTVYVVGANSGTRDIRDRDAVKQFWMRYFEQAGARCADYSAISVPLALGQ